MANLLWGKVYLYDEFVGILRQEPGEASSFTYDPEYISKNLPPISYSLPLRKDRYISYNGIHPFFDNLVAEGWLESAQSRILGKRHVSRFELLLAFGYDCIGAISIIDPEPHSLSEKLLDMKDVKEAAAFTGRASLSGVQPKLAIIEKNGRYYPAKFGEMSTHIAKFPSATHPDIIYNEYLTSLAFKSLLPDDGVVDIKIGEVENIAEPAIIIKRFDRSENSRIHFEEFNQLLGYKSTAKYDGSYKEMSDFIQNNPRCIPTEIYQLCRRIVAGILLGNTDMHFKNFAMFHTKEGLRLTPTYDMVAASLYDYKTMALAMGGASNLKIGDLKPKNIITLAKEFNLPVRTIPMIVKQLEKNKERAKQAIFESKEGKEELRDQLIKLMDKRWNGTFALIGSFLSKKQ
jgi:serine/threonine-protein kinase HipA